MANFCGNCGTQLEEDSVYCPNCGQKVMEDNVGIVDEKKFDPMTGKKLKKSKKGKRHIPAIATCILVIAVAAIILVKSGIFLSRSDQVLLALQNTLEESQLIRDLSKIRLVEKNNFTVELDGRLNGYKTNVLYIKDNSNKQIVRNFDDEDNFEVCLLKNDIMFRDFNNQDTVLLYQYRENPGLKLAEAAGEENIEALNTLIEKIYDEQLGRKLIKKDKDIILKKLRSLEFEKISSKKFDIKNKKRKCKGFSVEISKEDMMDVMQEIYEMHEKELSDVYETNNDWLDRPEWKEIEEELDDNFEDLESEINLYLYKNKLVGIEWETERYSIEMNLGGEDTILDEIEIVCQEYGQEFADIKVDGKNRDGKEVYEIQKNDMEYANITYDYEDEGKLEIQCIKRGIYLEADLEIKYNKITADVSSFVMDNDELFKGTVYIQKGGKVEKLEGEQSFIDGRMADYIKENRWKREYYYFLKAINDKDTDKIRKKYPQLAEVAEDFIEYNYYTLYDFWGGNDNLSPTDELWFSLIYLDDDEIPELYIEGDYEGLLVRSDGKTLQGVKWGDDIASYGGYRMDTYSIYYYNEREGMIISETDGPQLEFVVFQYEDGICKVVNHMSSPTYEEQEEYKNQTDILLDGIDELTEDNMKRVLGL